MSGCYSTIIRSQITTGAMVEKQAVSWRIENYNVVRRSNELIYAQQFTFSAGTTINLPTTWQCHLVSEQYEGKQWMGVFLRLLVKPVNVEEVNVTFTVKLVKPNGKHCFKASLKNMANPNVWNWGFGKILEREMRTELLPLFNGALCIDLDFTLYAFKPATAILLEDNPVACKLSMFKHKSIRQWSQDLSGLQNDPMESTEATAKIISKDGKVFPVNRDVLSARSIVFRAMFLSPMKEKETGEIQIDDLSSKTIQVILQYICTGSLHEDWSSVGILEELAYGAHKYELGLLMEFLDGVLGIVCTMDNVKQLALFAKRTGMKTAERDLFNYLRANATNLDDLMIALE